MAYIAVMSTYKGDSGSQQGSAIVKSGEDPTDFRPHLVVSEVLPIRVDVVMGGHPPFAFHDVTIVPLSTLIFSLYLLMTRPLSPPIHPDRLPDP